LNTGVVPADFFNQLTFAHDTLTFDESLNALNETDAMAVSMRRCPPIGPYRSNA
jgi:hypothetical protein